MERKQIIGLKRHLEDLSSQLELFTLSGMLKPVAKLYEDCICKNKDNNLEENDKIKIASVVDFLHEDLHTGHWSEVPLHTKQAYTAASALKAVITLKLLEQILIDDLKEALKILDMGILMGAPFYENFDCITAFAAEISKIIYNLKSQNRLDDIKVRVNNEAVCAPLLKKRKLDPDKSFEELTARDIECEQALTVTQFRDLYFTLEIPVKIQNCMKDWPACFKWQDVNYILKVAGNRTVPIEIGSQYSDQNWSQKLMIIEDFVTQYYSDETEEIGYLAQHNLFDQIPELFQDIVYPPFCFVSKSCETTIAGEPDINAWFGPKGTVSTLHHDPRDNILCQVYGRKQVLMFAPKDSEYLYPHETKLLSNTAKIDPVNPNLEKYPNFTKATMYRCILEGGEMLYIPKKWWHYVTSLEKSFSVNFWWE